MRTRAVAHDWPTSRMNRPGKPVKIKPKPRLHVAARAACRERDLVGAARARLVRGAAGAAMGEWGVRTARRVARVFSRRRVGAPRGLEDVDFRPG